MMSFIRFSVRRNVLLPQPDGPMNADTWFECRPIEMSCRTRRLAVVEVQVLDADLERGFFELGAGATGALVSCGAVVSESATATCTLSCEC